MLLDWLNFIGVKQNFLDQNMARYGHSQSKISFKKLGVGDKYHRSIKVHT